MSKRKGRYRRKYMIFKDGKLVRVMPACRAARRTAQPGETVVKLPRHESHRGKGPAPEFVIRKKHRPGKGYYSKGRYPDGCRAT